MVNSAERTGDGTWVRAPHPKELTDDRSNEYSGLYLKSY